MIAIGDRFGRLVVVGRDGSHQYSGGKTTPKYKVRCDCGTEKSVIGKTLINKNAKSCGCLYKEQAPMRGKRMIQKRFSGLWLMDEEDYQP